MGRRRGNAVSERLSRRQLGTHRAVPVLVTVALAVAVISGSFVLKSTVSDQERRLLDVRAGEVVLLLDSSFNGIQSDMARLGAVARYGNLKRIATTSEAESLADSATSPGRTFALLRKSGDGFTVTAAGGPALKKGDRASSAHASLASEALNDPKLQSSGVLKDGQRSTFALALGPPATPPGHAVLLISAIDPSQTQPSDPSSPFNDINVALYASPKVQQSQLVVKTTNQAPLEGDVVQKQLKVGSSDWLVAMTAREPLAGSFTKAAPWILLVLGLIGSLIAGGFLNALQRRRDYAIDLVDQRTAELQDSLQQLGEAQKSLGMQQRLAAVGQVAAAVGHELRNPLGVMTNAIFLARTQLPSGDAEMVGRHLDTTEREITAATMIVESLLGFTRAKKPAKQWVDFDELFAEALTVTPPPQGVEVVQVGLDTLPPIRADRQRLRQVILNLLTNSFQAMEGKGVITVAARAHADKIELTFSDTGPGLDKETAEQIFQPFFTRKASGIGLGLAVTEQIVEAHGGSIKVKSNPGEGATFVICLPNTVPVKEGVKWKIQEQ